MLKSQSLSLVLSRKFDGTLRAYITDFSSPEETIENFFGDVEERFAGFKTFEGDKGFPYSHNVFCALIALGTYGGRDLFRQLMEILLSRLAQKVERCLRGIIDSEEIKIAPENSLHLLIVRSVDDNKLKAELTRQSTLKNAADDSLSIQNDAATAFLLIDFYINPLDNKILEESNSEGIMEAFDVLEALIDPGGEQKFRYYMELLCSCVAETVKELITKPVQKK